MKPVAPPDMGKLEGEIISGAEWSERTGKFQGLFQVAYQAEKGIRPLARCTGGTSNHKQSLNIQRAGGALIAIGSEFATPLNQWYTSDQEELPGSPFEVAGWCYPQGQQTKDRGVILSALAYRHGLHLKLRWMDTGDTKGEVGPGVPDWQFQNNNCEFFLPLNYGSDFREVAADKENFKIILKK
jgi:hypothetical protein